MQHGSVFSIPQLLENSKETNALASRFNCIVTFNRNKASLDISRF